MKHLLLSLLLLLAAPYSLSAQDYVFASYNIRNDANDFDRANGDGWDQRKPYMVAQLQFIEPDIFGVQEAIASQMKDLSKDLTDYAYVGCGRDDGKKKGEYAAIFYNTKRFTLLDSGNFWLSETPDIVGSKGWDAALTRVCSWGKFRDNQSGYTFMFYNTHLDHIGKKARSESAKLILQKVVETNGGLPSVITGDFNVDQSSEPYKVLAESGVLSDAYETADIRFAPTGTFNDFSTEETSLSRIDHIFLTKDFHVRRYAIPTSTYRYQSRARTISDHFPVVVKVRVNP